MKVHIITNLFHPDELAGAALFTDLALYLRQKGHDVRVTTTFSYYPAWKLRPEDRGLTMREEEFRGITVRRLAMHVPAKVTGGSRMLSDLSFFAALVRRGTFRGWRPDVVLTASPMFSQCVAQRFLYSGQKVPRLIVVQDFVVDAALELNILRLPGFGAFLQRLERWAFESACTLATISEPMLRKLGANVRGSRSLRLIPNWIHTSLQAEIDHQSRTTVERAQATLFYSGNLGVKQGLRDFVQDFVAAGGGWSLKIHGGGGEAEELRGTMPASTSITLGGVLDEGDYVAELRRATACLVTQKAGVGANFLPSKLLPALATGTPVLAVCERNSPLGAEIVTGGFGEVVLPGNREALQTTLRRWANEPSWRDELGRRAAERARLYSRDRILPQYEAELRRLA